MIDAIEHAIAARDWRAALDTALDGWQKRHAPELADLVAALGAQLATPALPRAPMAVFQELWLIALAADPVANLGPALATLTRLLPLGKSGEAPGSSSLRRKYAPWLARVAALRNVDDPRVASAFFEVLREPPFLDAFAGEHTVYDPALDALERLGDVRQIVPLRALAASPTAPRRWLRELQATELRWLAEALQEQAVLALSSDERMRVAAILARLDGPRAAARRATNDEELLALVHDDPEDDGAREVLADLWLERGDPRGELVILQLKDARGSATDADRKKVRAILREHEKGWLGPLAAVTVKRRFERGFLDRLELGANSVASPVTWASALAVPALRTVRTIDAGRANTAHYRSFVLAAPNLRSAGVARTSFDELAARSPPRLAHLRLGFALTPKIVNELTTTFPGLMQLTFPVTATNIDTQLDFAAKLVARRPALRVSATSGQQAVIDEFEAKSIARRANDVAERRCDDVRPERSR